MFMSHFNGKQGGCRIFNPLNWDTTITNSAWIA